MRVQQQSFLTVERYHHPDRKPVMVRELPAEERPVNRLHQRGPSSLSTAELIAAIIQTPTALHTANLLLARFDGLLGLARASTQELMEVDGLGPSKVAQLKAALELGRRFVTTLPQERPKIRNSSEAAQFLMLDMMTLQQEHFSVILLDCKNRIIRVETLYKGNLTAAIVRVGEIFAPAIKYNAAAIIVAHNHPSGDPTPSPEDITVTRSIVQAGKLLDIKVLDHLIIGQQRYVSLRERGLGFD